MKPESLPLYLDTEGADVTHNHLNITFRRQSRETGRRVLLKRLSRYHKSIIETHFTLAITTTSGIISHVRSIIAHFQVPCRPLKRNTALLQERGIPDSWVIVPPSGEIIRPLKVFVPL